MKQFNILVIDDSTTNIVLLEAILEENGYKTDTALSVKEAIHCIDKKLPDLIILDLLMPGISGYEFLDHLMANEKTKMIPVIVVSAVTDDENIRKILDKGAADFIKKPIDIQHLISTIEKTLQGSGS